MTRLLTTYCLSVLLLVTNAGIPVFTHICHGMGKSWSSIVVPSKSCCSNKKAIKSLNSCHAGNVPFDSHIEKNPCCENRTAVLTIDSDFIQPVSESIYVFLHVFSSGAYQQAQRISFISSLTGDLFQTHIAPLLFYGRSLLILHQVFRL